MEGLERISRKEDQRELQTPYHTVTLEAFGKEIPEKKEQMEAVLKEIDAQGIKNFGSYKSESMPGVSFSFSKLSVTPEVISKLAKTSTAPDQTAEAHGAEEETGEEKMSAKRQDFFLFTAFAPPPEGHAFTVGDVAIDRFIRLLPRVARPMSQGEQVPEINVYLLGAPTGFGGSVTPEWVEAVQKDGLEAHAKLYAEFIERHEPHDDKDFHLVLQGVSKGAVVAEKVSKYLPAALQHNTQRLLDNPAGHHKPGQFVQGAQVAIGQAGEALTRMLFDTTMMQPLMKMQAGFVDALSKRTGIPKDDQRQKELKQKAVVAEGLALLKGSPMDTETTRSFIRRGLYDPLTFSYKTLSEVNRKVADGIKTPMFSKGKSLETPFKGTHFFMYRHYKRWAQILDYVKGRRDAPVH